MDESMYISRMHELVGRAIAEGEKFWQELGVEPDSESDEDYVESSVDEDQVDSDFDVSDDEGEGAAKHAGRKVKIVNGRKATAGKTPMSAVMSESDGRNGHLNGKKKLLSEEKDTKN